MQSRIEYGRKLTMLQSDPALTDLDVYMPFLMVQELHFKSEFSHQRVQWRTSMGTIDLMAVRHANMEALRSCGSASRLTGDRVVPPIDMAVVPAVTQVIAVQLSVHDRALKRAKMGLAGICEECGELISAKRLSALDAVTTCIVCARRHEER